MKVLLGGLMCLVLTIAQTFAISGGPWGRTGQVTVTGTYAGVMFATSHVPISGVTEPTALNQIGLFSLPIPKTGLGNGTAVVFDQGQIYTGTIQASGDPDSGKVTGIFSASFPYIIIVTSTDSTGHTTQTPVEVIAQASGRLDAKVKASSQTSSGAIRLRGNADVQFALTVNSPFDEIIFKVIGFKQAEL